MADNTHAQEVLRSFLPETYLIDQHAATALGFKYVLRLRGYSRLRSLRLTDSEFWCHNKPDFSPYYREYKYLDGLSVEGDCASPVGGEDLSSGYRIRLHEKDATFLHISSLSGPHHMRSQLRAAAEYIRANETLRQTRHVAGLTYSELGRLAMRIGFRPMSIYAIDTESRASLQASHQAFTKINGKQTEFKPLLVFLPTYQFIEQFAPSEQAPAAAFADLSI